MAEPPTWMPNDIERYDGPKLPFCSHNLALKKIRTECEDEDGRVRTCEAVDVTENFLALTLPDETRVQWTWQPMLQTLNEESLLRVAGEGIRRIVCKPIASSYDFRRHHRRKEEDRKRLRAQGMSEN